MIHKKDITGKEYQNVLVPKTDDEGPLFVISETADHIFNNMIFVNSTQHETFISYIYLDAERPEPEILAHKNFEMGGLKFESNRYFIQHKTSEIKESEETLEIFGKNSQEECSFFLFSLFLHHLF